MSNRSLFISFSQPRADELDRFRRYVDASIKLALEHGAEASSQFDLRQLIGDSPASFVAVATFPNTDAITTMFAGDRALALGAERKKSVEAVNADIVDDAPTAALADPEGVYLVIVSVPNPKAKVEIEAYQAASAPLFAKQGARPVAQLQVTGRPVRAPQAEFIEVLEFDSGEAAEAVFGDPDYQALISQRDRGLASFDVYVTT